MFTCPVPAAFDPENRSWAPGPPPNHPKTTCISYEVDDDGGGGWLLSAVNGYQTHSSISCSSSRFLFFFSCGEGDKSPGTFDGNLESVELESDSNFEAELGLLGSTFAFFFSCQKTDPAR